MPLFQHHVATRYVEFSNIDWIGPSGSPQKSQLQFRASFIFILFLFFYFFLEASLYLTSILINIGINM